MAGDTLFPDAESDWREQAVAEYRQRRQELVGRIQHISRDIAELEAQLSSAKADLVELDRAAAVFGLSVAEGDEVVQRARNILRRTAAPIFKSVALDLLKKSYPKPMKAAEVREAAEQIMGETFHPKTAGMTLYRLSQDNLVRREGHKWFYVPQEEGDAETASPSSSADDGESDA